MTHIKVGGPLRADSTRLPARGAEPMHANSLPRELMTRLTVGGLRPLRLAGRELLPIVQGGMGVGVSAHRLAGSVAALEADIDAVVVGAGLPLDLPDLAREHPSAALIPILSDPRDVALVVKKWERKQRVPDAIVIEHPGWAGCHLGAAKLCDVKKGLFFRRAGALPFGVQVASVRALLERLLTPAVPLGTPVAL